MKTVTVGIASPSTDVTLVPTNHPAPYPAPIFTPTSAPTSSPTPLSAPTPTLYLTR